MELMPSDSGPSVICMNRKVPRDRCRNICARECYRNLSQEKERASVLGAGTQMNKLVAV